MKSEITFNVMHLCCGIGGSTLGMQNSVQEYKGLRGKFRTLVGIDNDPEACKDFERITGIPAVQMDLFDRQGYIDFHECEPPEGWQEVTPQDLRATTNGISPDVVFTSPPCKGFSGLVSKKNAQSKKYKALNNLTLRTIYLTLLAYENDLPGIILLENVPRITTRGSKLLLQIKQLLEQFGYLLTDGYHDCGELGGLGQHRRRYLLIARQPNKIATLVYKPPKQRVKSIGEILQDIPLPDDPTSGPLHRLPRLEWKTWVRLALIPPGGDWRDLENIQPEQYRIQHVPRGSGPYGVQKWDKPGKTVIGNASASGSNPACISDPRTNFKKNTHHSIYRVTSWNSPAGTVTSGVGPTNGAITVSDPRLKPREGRHPCVYQIVPWDNPAPTVTGTRFGSGAPAVADPRTGSGYSNKRKILKWNKPATTITGTPDIQSGAQSVGDPRLGCSARNGLYGVMDWNKPACTVTGARNVHSGSSAVADPRIPGDKEKPDPPPVIIALDGTWHRPLTTLELAALQGFPLTLPDGQPLTLAGKSDQRYRERIGNAVPVEAAQAMWDAILKALLPNVVGDWVLGATGIWVDRIRNIETPSIAEVMPKTISD